MPFSRTHKDVMVITFFHRLRACLERSSGKQVAVEPGSAPSRVEQNLAWLPVNRRYEALDLPPPEIPLLGLVGAPLQQRYVAFLAQVISAPVTDDALRDTGRHLARELLSQAITLGSSKGTENSDEIYWLVQSAAIASLFADGAQSPEFAGYRQHVVSYQSADRMAAQVAAFDRYVAANGQPRRLSSD